MTEKKEAPKVDYKKQVSQEELEAKMKAPKVIELANQLGDGKPKTKATNGYLNAVSVGKMLTDQGVGVWQHPDFNIKTGFTGSGLEGMMKRASNSFHSSGEALDIPIAGQGEERLNQIASLLGANTNLPSIGINAHNMASGDFFEISSISGTGFTVHFKNSSNASIDRNFTYQAVGFGKGG